MTNGHDEGSEDCAELHLVLLVAVKAHADLLLSQPEALGLLVKQLAQASALLCRVRGMEAWHQKVDLLLAVISITTETVDLAELGDAVLLRTLTLKLLSLGRSAFLRRVTSHHSLNHQHQPPPLYA